MTKKKEIVLALVAMLGLAAESSAAGGVGASAGLEASTKPAVSADAGASITSGATSLSPSTSLTPLGATGDVTATLPPSATTKVTLDSPALDVTSQVVAAQGADSSSTITVGAPAAAAIINGGVETSKPGVGADADASTSIGSGELPASASAIAQHVTSVLRDADTGHASFDIAGQSSNAFDLSAAAGMEHALPLASRLAVMPDAAVSTVPEADTYAMLLAGLGLMGFMVNRRREKRT